MQNGINEKRLENALDQALPSVVAALQRFPWEDRTAYGHWLAQSHFLVRHTTTFLAMVAAKLGARNPEKHRDVLKHLREEVGHEELAIRDLKALNLEIGMFPELVETSLIYQSQYYWIEQGGPVSHVGYSLMLEGLAVREGKWLLDKIETLHGKGTASFIRVHALDDVAHFQEGVSRLSGASAEEIKLAISNLEQSQYLYTAMLERIRREVLGNLIERKKVA